MVCFQSSHDSNERAESQKRVVVLVSFDDEQIGGTAPEIALPRGHAPSDDAGRVEARGSENSRSEGGRRRFPVSTRNTDDSAAVDHRRECFGALEDRDSEAPRLRELGGGRTRRRR